MADCRTRKRDPCTSYKREDRTFRNIFECCPRTPDLLCKDKRGRHRPDVYECCPPTPVELRCCICWTAERDGCNLWSCVPFLSYSTVFGTTFADIIVFLLNLLPLTLLACLGIAHPRCCSAKPCPPVIKCDPPREKSPLLNCEKKCKKPCYPCPKLVTQCGGGEGDTGQDELMAWMHVEYEALARDLADMQRLTNDGNGLEGDSQDVTEARNYVLDRLAELLAKREEIEKRLKRRKEKNGKR